MTGTLTSPLQAVREELGLTRGQAAEATGVLYSSWYNAERGIGAIPRKVQVALAELGVDVDELLAAHREWLATRAAARRQAILAQVGGARA